MGILHNVKNFTGGYTYSQRLVRNVTASNNSVPNEPDMHEIAKLSFEPREMPYIMDTIKERMGINKGNWLQVNKTLTLLLYLVRHGDVSVTTWCRRNEGLLRSLSDSSINTHGDITQQAHEIISLINDPQRWHNEREEAKPQQKVPNTKGRVYQQASSRTGASGAGATWFSTSGATFL